MTEGSRRMKALVLDRDDGGRQAYMAIARSCGWLALAATDEDPQIFRLIQDHAFDALILGLSLEVDLDALRRLREAGVEIPAILISAITLDHRAAQTLGVRAILSKPPEVSELRAALKTLEDPQLSAADFEIIFRFLERCAAMDRSKWQRGAGTPT